MEPVYILEMLKYFQLLIPRRPTRDSDDATNSSFSVIPDHKSGRDKLPAPTHSVDNVEKKAPGNFSQLALLFYSNLWFFLFL